MEKRKRVVVTGMGVVSCFGNDVEQFYKALLDGKSGVRSITAFPCDDYPTRIAAEILDFDPGEWMDKKQARRVDKTIAYTVVAGKKSLQHANLYGQDGMKHLDLQRCGIIIGTGMGGMSVYTEGVRALIEQGHKKVSPFFIPYTLTNMCGAILGIDLGFMGPNYSISTACATANFSLIAAANHIRSGDADLMIAGGVEGAITPIGLAGFCACKALSQKNDTPEQASSPWDKKRDGFVMGEGAGVLVLESLEHAQARGATIYAEYLGGGMSCDAFHLTNPREDGLGVVQCVHNALKNAGVLAEEIEYINAHATSTPAGDMSEIRALKTVFQNRGSIAINATKSLVGHLLGAAGGVEAIATVQALATGWIHPTLNLTEPEEELDFHAPIVAERREVKKAISNSFGFGGHNASVIFGKFSP